FFFFQAEDGIRVFHVTGVQTSALPISPEMPPAPQTRWESPAPSSSANQPPSAPSGIPSAGGLSADEQLDGPVLALLTTAQQQQRSEERRVGKESGSSGTPDLHQGRLLL